MRSVTALVAAGFFALQLVALANAADVGEDIGDTSPYPASWDTSFSVDFVYAARTTSGNEVIIEDTVTGDTILDSGDFGDSWAPGVDVRLGVERGNQDIAVRFLGAFNWDPSESVTTSDIWSILTNPELFGLGAAETIADYSSMLNSIEVNAARPFGDNGTVFAGVRGVLLNENLDILSDFGSNMATVTSEADTIGVGPQVGTEFRTGGPVFVGFDGRIGALLTRSNLDFGVDQEDGPPFEASGDPWNWAGVAEAGIQAGVMIGRSTSIRVGYRALYLHNMPTATSSIGSTNVVDGSIGHSSQGILVHGATFGVEGHF
jgi:hypothetical protein